MASTTQWSYRIPFALQWVFPLPILLAVYFAPESPWWLVRQSRAEEAKANLRRLRNKPKDTNEEDHEKTLDRGLTEMYETNQREKEQESGISYLDCFKGTNRRRTEIACMSWVIQTLCGSTFMGFSTYFCKSAIHRPNVEMFEPTVSFSLLHSSTVYQG
jgi:SP family general alpha glucoside:H+ symporter-like MFS transporter